MADQVSPAQSLIDNINFYLSNPAALQQTILNFTRTATNNEYQYVDPTNPVVNAIESAVLTSSATLSSYEAVLRKQYAVLAQDWDDLFLHMSDKDYLDRFAIPAKTQFSMMFNKTEILNKMVSDPVTGYKKIVIPRNTFFTVAGVIFALEYPIEIRQLNHGGIQIVYNTDIPSPIQELSTNAINWDQRQDSNGNIFINFTFDVTQVNVSSRVYDLNSSTHFSATVALSDEYYFTRVFLMDNSGAWNEVYTTHSDVVYDVNTFTAVLQVTDSNLTIGVPEIYTANSTNNRKIRIDVYQTKGPISMMLDSYPNSSYSVTWQAFNEAEMDQYTAPLQTLETIIVYSSQSVAGGKSAMTFEELRDRVITNAIGTPYLPISNIQIKNSLEDANYEIVKNIDVITNRVFLASRNLPTPSNPKLITAANASIQTGLFTMAQATQVATVIDNGTSITITPDTIFKNVNGKVTLLSTSDLNSLLNLSIDQRALKINSNDYFYSPFHYVLDASTDTFDVRPYYLDSPTIESKVFVAENDTTKLQVTIGSYQIIKNNTGYKIQVELRTSDEFKALNDSEVYTQLMFNPVGETDNAYINGTLLGLSVNSERIYEFDLQSSFNLNSKSSLLFNNFFMYTTDPKILGAALFQEFNVLVATTHPMDLTYKRSSVDDALGAFLLPQDVYAISQEIIRVRFGYFLDKLWARARSVVSESNYQKYATDIVATYSSDVYEMDPNTGSTIFIENGAVVRHLLHSAGDPIVIDGQTQYSHRAGDVMYDSNGDPIIASARSLYREVDYMLIEGSYWFATDQVATNYRSEMTNIFVSWITNDLTAISSKLLEQTKIYFYPKTTTGNIDVMVKDGVTTTISASQQFLITVYVNGTVYRNTDLKNQLKVRAIEILNDELTNSVVSVSHITNSLSDAFGDDAIDILVEGLGASENYQAVTVINGTDRPSIKKIVKAQSDGSLIVEEAVELLFIRHELDS